MSVPPRCPDTKFSHLWGKKWRKIPGLFWISIIQIEKVELQRHSSPKAEETVVQGTLNWAMANGHDNGPLLSKFCSMFNKFEIRFARLPYQETAKVWRSNLNITYTSTRVKYGFNDVQPLSLQIQTSTNHWTTWRHHFCPLREMAGSCICLVIKTPKSQPFRRPRLLLRHVFPTSRLLCPNGDGCHYARLLNNEHGRKHRF